MYKEYKDQIKKNQKQKQKQKQNIKKKSIDQEVRKRIKK